MDDEDRNTRISLRMPKQIHEQLSKVAHERGRSMNTEIVDRLAQSLAPEIIGYGIERELSSALESLKDRDTSIRIWSASAKLFGTMAIEYMTRYQNTLQAGSDDYAKHSEFLENMKGVIAAYERIDANPPALNEPSGLKAVIPSENP